MAPTYAVILRRGTTREDLNELQGVKVFRFTPELPRLPPRAVLEIENPGVLVHLQAQGLIVYVHPRNTVFLVN